MLENHDDEHDYDGGKVDEEILAFMGAKDQVVLSRDRSTFQSRVLVVGHQLISV